MIVLRTSVTCQKDATKVNINLFLKKNKLFILITIVLIQNEFNIIKIRCNHTLQQILVPIKNETNKWHQHLSTTLSRPRTKMTSLTIEAPTVQTLTKPLEPQVSFWSSCYHQHRLWSFLLSSSSSLFVIEHSYQRGDRIHYVEDQLHRLADLLRHIMKLMSTLLLLVRWAIDKAM